MPRGASYVAGHENERVRVRLASQRFADGVDDVGGDLDAK
jgi:hypothetical protein